MTAREALIAKIRQQIEQEKYTTPGPVVNLEDFFEGNNDPGSIGCNLIEHPGIQQFYTILKNIRSKAEVLDVLIEIYDFNEVDETIWPFAEQIYILTSAPKEEVRAWVSGLQPDEVEEISQTSQEYLKRVASADTKIYSVWWD